MRTSTAFGAQAATLTAAVTMALIGLPALAQQTTQPIVPTGTAFELSDSAYAANVVSRFRKVGDPSTYDNASIETSAFDFQAYVASTCYRPTPYDMKMCETDFGPYANLRTTLESGQLRGILKTYKIIANRDAEVVVSTTPSSAPAQAASVTSTLEQQVAAESAQAAIVLTPEQQTVKLNAQRVAQLWSGCQESYPDADEAKLCFQRNYRIIYRYEVTVDGNIR